MRAVVLPEEVMNLLLTWELSLLLSTRCTTIWLVKFLRENSLTTTGSNFLDQSIKIYNEKKILVPEKACGTSKKALILRKLG